MSSSTQQPDLLEQFTAKDSRYYIVQNVLDISEAIVRGRRAGSNWEIFVYRVRSVAMAILGTTGGSGVTVGLTQPEASVTGYLVAGGSLALAIGLELYNQLKVEERATQAIKAREAFNELYRSMSAALRGDDPDETLVQLSTTADTLTETLSKVIVHDEAADITNAARNVARELVAKYSSRWQENPIPVRGRTIP